MPVKLHFTTNYDIVKYRGKIKTLDKSFEQKKDKAYYYKLGNLYSKEDLIDLCVSNMFEDASIWVGDLFSDKAKNMYFQYKGVMESLTYYFSEDIKFLENQDESLKEILIGGDPYPPIIQYMFWGNIKPQTICILNNYFNFIPRIDKKLSTDIVWETTSKKLKKLSPFVMFDNTKFGEIVDGIKRNRK